MEEVETMSNNIKDKVVVITGASSGLGEAAARDALRWGGDCRARRSPRRSNTRIGI